MNETDSSILNSREERESSGATSSIHGRLSAASFHDRLGELETENARLHRLVAELLIKNQKLRRID
ncbi:hypothetical protein [Granulicella sp. S190]|uniref:hypothetical protein n=1 Tax=Granulicella sp. S190 TaxID=1747226 RepID=UPI00131E6561|nr:hypothetical protein [Granulicella sp. S190]